MPFGKARRVCLADQVASMTLVHMGEPCAVDLASDREEVGQDCGKVPGAFVAHLVRQLAAARQFPGVLDHPLIGEYFFDWLGLVHGGFRWGRETEAYTLNPRCVEGLKRGNPTDRELDGAGRWGSMQAFHPACRIRCPGPRLGFYQASVALRKARANALASSSAL